MHRNTNRYEVQFGGGKIGPWGEFEQHISGDISFACRQHYYATHDLDFLKKNCWPLVKVRSHHKQSFLGFQ
jgi:trehalose/maltose hydrolase-like predicted phosphorylase